MHDDMLFIFLQSSSMQRLSFSSISLRDNFLMFPNCILVHLDFIDLCLSILEVSFDILKPTWWVPLLVDHNSQRAHVDVWLIRRSIKLSVLEIVFNCYFVVYYTIHCRFNLICHFWGHHLPKNVSIFFDTLFGHRSPIRVRFPKRVYSQHC